MTLTLCGGDLPRKARNSWAKLGQVWLVVRALITTHGSVADQIDDWPFLVRLLINAVDLGAQIGVFPTVF